MRGSRQPPPSVTQAPERLLPALGTFLGPALEVVLCHTGIRGGQVRVGEQGARQVEETFVHLDDVVELTVDGEKITTTEDHPFWSVTAQEFVRADALKPGDTVLGADWRELVVGSVRVVRGPPVPAYNLAVHDIHTYHVGNNDILVHNDCLTGGGSGGAGAANSAEGAARSAVTSTDVVTSPSAMKGLTPGQVDDLARNAGYEVLPGKAGAVNPAVRYYAPDTNRSVGFRVLHEGVEGQVGVKASSYLRFFGGHNHGERTPLGAL